ncbi:MAG: hypothetical protein AAFR47_01510 [Pseudomonadota bacterium]
MNGAEPSDFTSSPWSDLADAALEAAQSVPTMLTPREQKLYFWLTSVWAKGAGVTVDLGSFAGGSTARLAEGHRAAGRATVTHAFDRFTADEDVKARVLYKSGIAPFEGSDIFPLAQDLLAPWGRSIVFHRGEIEQMSWNSGPIEILVMDASKAAKTADKMAETFFPHLVPGRSVVVQQDYLHWSQPWVPAQMERLADHFRPCAHERRDTVVFLCTSAPTAEQVRAAATSDLDDSALDECLSSAMVRLTLWDIAPQLDDMRAALAANPGKRRAFEFSRP